MALLRSLSKIKELQRYFKENYSLDSTENKGLTFSKPHKRDGFIGPKTQILCQFKFYRTTVIIFFTFVILIIHYEKYTHAYFISCTCL